MANTIPMTQGVQAVDGNRRTLMQGFQTTRFEDATGGSPEGTFGNIMSPQTIDGETPTRIVVPLGAMKFVIRTNAANGLRIGNNADLQAGTLGANGLPLGSTLSNGAPAAGCGYIVANQFEWFEVGCQAQASGAAPTGQVSTLSTASPTSGTVINTTGNPEIYVMLNDADAGEAEIFFYFHMLY